MSTPPQRITRVVVSLAGIMWVVSLVAGNRFPQFCYCPIGAMEFVVEAAGITIVLDKELGADGTNNIPPPC